jgi:hypothetical protein
MVPGRRHENLSRAANVLSLEGGQILVASTHVGPVRGAPRVPIRVRNATVPCIGEDPERRRGDGGALMAEVQDPARLLVEQWLYRHEAEIRPKDIPAAASLLTLTVEGAIHLQLLADPKRLEDEGWRREVTDLMLRYLVP